MAYVFDTLEDIISYLQTLPAITDMAQREAEFKKYFTAYEAVVRGANDLSKVPDNDVHSKLINNLVYLTGYCNDSVRTCVEELTSQSLLSVDAEILTDKQR